MPKKKSIKKSVEKFKAEADKILIFLEEAKNQRDMYVSWQYDLAVIRLYREFEILMLNALVGALNGDTSTLSEKTGFDFPKHLTDEVCRYLVTGTGYFDFKGRDGLIKNFRGYLPDNHYLVQTVKNKKYKQSMEIFFTARNFAAHGSQQSKKSFLKAIDQQGVGSAGAWLKRQNRFQKLIVDKLKKLSDDIYTQAPY